ncbi:MAG: 3'(2'),5'-bisphosphate nucleotidase CysQ [Bacteroidales bacterium]
MNSLLSLSIQAALEAGKEILTVYSGSDFEVDFKSDNSPLTLADRRAHQAIVNHLNKTSFPVLSEEGRSIPYEERSGWKTFWMVDPLDGTKEFIKRNGEFTVNIALIESGIPVMGVIYVPVKRTLYFASSDTGSCRVEEVAADDQRSLEELRKAGQKLPVKNGKSSFVVVGSKSHMTPETETFIGEIRKEHPEAEILSRGSSLKLCMVAEGAADIYPRFAPTMEWDVAAGHAIARFAGKKVFRHDTGEELRYNKENLLNPWFIVQ